MSDSHATPPDATIEEQLKRLERVEKEVERRGGRLDDRECSVTAKM